jgi:hypothetical protein
MDSIHITTNEKRIPITRDGRNVGEIVFNPSDVDFAERFYRIVADFEVKLKEYETGYSEISTETDEHGVPVHADDHLNLLRETCTYIKEKIDYVFGSGTSEIVFGSALVLDMFPQFFDGIKPFIQSARSEKIVKYLVAQAPAAARAIKDIRQKPRKRK